MKKLTRFITAVLSAILLYVPAQSIAIAEAAPETPVPQPCRILYYTDAEHTKPFADFENLDPATYLYYNIECDAGYFCKRMTVCADHADTEKIRFGTASPDMIKLEYALLGDINDDGKITLTDATDILHFIARNYYRTRPDILAADLNGDKKITLLDVVMILKLIAKWDVELCDGIAEDFELYCKLNVEAESRETFMDTEQFFFETSVIKSTDGLDKYINEHSEMYRMEQIDDTNSYSSTELKETYTADFFKENVLVIYDFSEATSFGNLYIERTGDTLELVIPNCTGYGVAFSTNIRVHKMIPVKKSLGIDLDGGISHLWRNEFNLVAKQLYNFEARPVDESYIKINYYE
ncbi:MAG: hypothetical protein E7578_03415 [Ruminococcaceae bacterium]|nr:hypothetical protein [Oscillospiraceae bacterium]